MKKVILISTAIVGLTLGAYAQGSLSNVNNTGIYFGDGVDSQDPTSLSVYVGNLTLEVFFSITATAGDVTAINNLDGTAGGGAAALAVLGSDGFTEVDLGGLSGAADANSMISGFAATIVLSSAFAPDTAGDLVLYFVDPEGASGAFAFSGNYGGQQPGGSPFDLSGDSDLTSLASANNLALTSPVPEPGPAGLVGFGGLSLFLFRRNK